MKSDKQITDNIIQVLLWDARVSPARIDVHTENGYVTLSGTVDNYYKKWSAIDNAMKVSGVVEVIDQIKVKPKDLVKDVIIQGNIEKAFSNDSRLEQCHISGNVRNGSVSLTGKVKSFYQKIAAEESCRWVKGVTNVENHIDVVPRGIDHDKQIRRRIKDLIEQNMRADTNEIDIKVENGIVLLKGRVSNLINKIYAETLASLVTNVTFVQNELILSHKDDNLT
jgi:osmotically-inducible protein OsmY